MKVIISLLISMVLTMLLIIACEQRHDPFSAINKNPVIQTFNFEDDSLKYSKEEPFKLFLKYRDTENQQLTATFSFLSGHGDIFHSGFKIKSRSQSALVFDAPSAFDSYLNFIPDTTGKVEIILQLSDKVKISSANQSVFFYKNLNPVAKFTYRIKTTVAPYDLEVDASQSTDPDRGKIEWYHWSFGDNTPVVKIKSTTYQYRYQNAGTFTVKLKVIDNDGGMDSTELAISTNNQPPLANLQVNPRSGEAPLTINYTATNSTDPDGKISAYRIDFGDGASTLDSAGTHIYTADSDYRVKLTVQDNLGQTDTTGVTVRVSTAPVAVLKITPAEGPFPLECVIDGTGSYDPQGGKLEHDIYIDGQITYDNIDKKTHTFTVPKIYLVRLLVTSLRNNKTDDSTMSVNAINLAPVADFDYEPKAPQHRTPVIYDASKSYDPNTAPYDGIASYEWIFPDETKPINGMKVEHAFDAGFGTYKVILTVKDNFGKTSSIEKIIK